MAAVVGKGKDQQERRQRGDAGEAEDIAWEGSELYLSKMEATKASNAL